MKKTSLTFASLALCFGIASAQTATPPSAEAIQQAAAVVTAPAPVTTPTPQATPVVAAPVAEQKISWYGFVKHEAFYNSRRSFELREGVVNMQPLDKLNGTALSTSNDNWKDQNDFGNFHMTSVFSRLGLKLSGITALGAKASGMLETDFMGTGNGQEDILRLRHAYVELDWVNSDTKSGVKLLVGQYWNPMFLSNCFPTVASTTTGIPFHPFGWVPQIKATFQSGPVSILGIIYTERALNHGGFSSTSVAGTGYGTNAATTNFSIEATRYSGTPNFHAQVQFNNGLLDVGAGVDISTLRPTLSKSAVGNFADTVNTSVLTSLTYMGYAKITTKKLVLKGYSILGTNFTQFVGLGGFAIYKDAATDALWKYTAQQTLSSWVELIAPSTQKVRIEPAIWVGYMVNMGTMTDLTGKSGASFVGRGISNARTFNNYFRIAPRLDVYSNKFKFSVEYSMDQIEYGNTDLNNYKIKSADPFKFSAVNHRINFATVYNF